MYKKTLLSFNYRLKVCNDDNIIESFKAQYKVGYYVNNIKKIIRIEINKINIKKCETCRQGLFK